MTRTHLAFVWLMTGALVAVTAGCGVQAPSRGSAAGASGGGSAYNVRSAGSAARHLLGLVRLPPGTRRSAHQPAGTAPALSSYSVSVPVVPHLVDRHEFFVASGTPASVIGWMQRHPPAGSRQGDYGSADAGRRWTSFAFPSIRGFAASPTLVLDAVPARGGGVALRVDAQVAPRPRLPGDGRGPGDVRVVEQAAMLGSFGYDLRCDPAGGTVPSPARVCAAIVHKPALLYSVPGPGHSCPAGAAAVSITGHWRGRPLHSTFSVCTGGQEEQAEAWADLLPGLTSLRTVHVDRGIGLVGLGEAEAAVVDLLRGARPAPDPCEHCTRSFGAGYSVGYGAGPAQPAGWTVSFTRSRLTRIATNVQTMIAGAYPTAALANLHRRLPGWDVRSCGTDRALVHTSPTGRTLVLYQGTTFQRVIVTTANSGC